MTPDLRYTPSRCQAFFGCWIKGGTELMSAPDGWWWEHPEAGCYRIYPSRQHVGTDLAATILVASFHVDRSALAGSKSSIQFNFNASTAVPPATGQIRLDSANQPAATSVRVSFQAADSADVRTLVMSVGIGNRLIIQDDNTTSKYQVYDATADAADMGTYADIPAAWVGGGSALTAQRVLVSIGNSQPPQSGTLISEIENDAYVIWTFDAAGVLKDIGVSLFVFAPMQ
jgi:hypothetical protein